MNELMKKAGMAATRTGMKLRKHSPEILIVAGVVGTVVSAVMACKATTKVSAVMDSAKEQINTIHNFAADETKADIYSEEDAKKDLTIVYVQTGVKLLKLYGPSVALGMLSIGSILASNHIQRQRNVALAAAYAAVDTGFKEYRNRVVEKFGDEVDKQLRYNIKAETIEEKVTDEKGREKVVKKNIEVGSLSEYSEYARIFDDGCNGWQKDAEYNLLFLRSQQQYANDLLNSRGHVFLNEIYDMLGIPRTKAGQIVGWVKNGSGDGYVDFGIYDVNRPKARDFVNGYERVIVLDFNVDGVIWDKI